MSDKTPDAFREIMVQEAARDQYLQGFQEWHISGKTDLVSESFLDAVDEADVCADLAEHYDLQPEEILRVLEISEDLVITKMTGLGNI